MAKLGQGFSKVYTKSQYEGSYYGQSLVAGGQSAGDLKEPLRDDMYASNSKKQFSLKTRVTTGEGRRQRPMTAKVSKKSMY